MATTHDANFAETNPGVLPLAGLATYEESVRVGLSADENADRITLPIRLSMGATTQ